MSTNAAAGGEGLSYAELERTHALNLYPKRGITIVKGAGATLEDESGRTYIDCTAGVGVANLGHAHPRLVEAISAQAAKLITCPTIFDNDTRARLLAKLAEVTPAGLNRAFLCNSGAEANEAAIKFARHATGKNGFVSAMRGFHGRTMGALSATHKYRDAFEPLLPGFGFAPYNNLDKLAAAVTEDTAAIVIELVQGEGGVRPAKAEFVKGVRELCDERGVLMIVDEVQTGFCRTGRFFACEHFDVQPDILCMAKAMGGGLPLGGVMVNDKVDVSVGLHGTTFGGNPMVCAAALATIEIMQDEELAARAAERGQRFAERFDAASLPKVREVRQLGLMIGVELKEKARPYLEALMDEGILALPAGPTVVRLLPPLVISEAQIDEVADTLQRVLA